MANMTVRGDKEIIDNLRRTTRSISGSFLSKAMNEALKPMKDQTQQNAKALRNYAGKYSTFFPQPTGAPPGGHLDQGLAIADVKNLGPLRREKWLGFRKRARKVAHLVEYGTAPHYQPNFKGGFFHPGAAAHPFFRPAFESTKGDVVDHMGNAIWRRISGSIVGAGR